MATKKKKREINYKRIIIKLLLSFVYLSIIGVLFYSAFTIFTEEKKIVKWSEVEKTNQYTYLEITQMSEAFAKIENKQIHFVMEKETTGAWHTYLIAINEEDYSKYKDIIDYTYERTTTKPENMKVYGYPIKTTKKMKSLAIQNITKFVPVENEIKITEDNFEQYLTDTYLDTTIEKIDSFNYYVVILLLGAFVIFIILIYTVFEKDKTQEKTNNKKKKTKKKKPNNQTVDATPKDKEKQKSTIKKKKEESNSQQKKSVDSRKKQEKVVEESKNQKNSKTNHETKKNVQNKSTTKKKDEDLEII